VLFFGVVIMMFVQNWVLALVTIGASLLGFAVMGVILKSSQKYFNQKQQCLGKLNGHIEEIYTNYNVVRSYNAIDNERQKFDAHNKNIYKVTWKAQFLSGLMHPIMAFVGNLAYLLIFVVGVSIIISGGSGVTVGTLTAFIIYARLFSQPLQNIAQSMSSIQQASAASRRVFEILDAEELEDENQKTEKHWLTCL
jgi:ATP-binding cassette subfamily B protein